MHGQFCQRNANRVDRHADEWIDVRGLGGGTLRGNRDVHVDDRGGDDGGGEFYGERE